MAKFHKVKVADVRKETEDCVSIAFDIPANLKQEYSYIQGQYLTLKLFVKGEELRRSYSICSSPTAENEIRIAVKRVKDGRGSNYVYDKLKAGDELEVMTPMGNFYSEMKSSNKKNYVLFAGGSGITPMLSIVKTVLKEEPQSTIQLFYGNQNEESTIFKKQLDEFEKNNSSRLKVVHVLDKPATQIPALQQGILSKEKITALIENYVGLNLNNEFFICGPTPMMDNCKAVLEQLKIEKSKIHIEYFTASLEAAKAPVANSGDKVSSQVTVILDGKETVMELASDGDVILDAALNADLDVPFACKGAVCCTCRAKVLEGKVKMDQNFALTDSEVEEGFILTCQSHPITPVVKVDYDV